MIVNDIVEVIYAPVKAFKRIVANPKYLGALIILLLFVAVSIGYEYAQFSKTYTENTNPGIDKLAQYTNATLWTTNSGVSLTNNALDFYNYSVYVASLQYPPTDSNGYYNVFSNYTSGLGPSSLEINTVDASSVSANINDVFNVDCGSGGFNNLTMAVKLVAPQTVPQSATVTLYSVSEANFYTYDLTSLLSDSSAIDTWQNFTLTTGPSAQGWTTSGTPDWGNITALKLDFAYPSSSNITLRVGALFFHGQYQTPIEYNSTGLLLQFLQLFALQFILGWLIITGVMYIFFKGLKTEITWKPVLIAMAFALFVMVIRQLVVLITALTLPPVYYPFDVSLGVRFDSFGAVYCPSRVVSSSLQHLERSIRSLPTCRRSPVLCFLRVAGLPWRDCRGNPQTRVLPHQTRSDFRGKRSSHDFAAAFAGWRRLNQPEEASAFLFSSFLVVCDLYAICLRIASSFGA